MSSLSPVLTVGAAAAAGVLGGCILGKWVISSDIKPAVWKSIESSDPVTRYVIEHSLRLHPVQEKLIEETVKHPQGIRIVPPEVCQLLQNLVRSMHVKKVIEIGVFTGVVTLSIALGLPEDGKVIACDINKEFSDIGRPCWRELLCNHNPYREATLLGVGGISAEDACKAGVERKIDLRIQAAEKTLDEMLEKQEGAFDLAFIDADKISYDIYYEKCLKLVRKGGIIILNHVLYFNTVLEENPGRPGAREMQILNDKLQHDPRIDISMLILGGGLTLAFKR